MNESNMEPPSWEGRTVGEWRLEQRLGEGGMSYVYLGQHQRLPHRGAVKVLRAELCQDEEAIERFRREAMASSQLKHPNIVHIHDFGHDESVGHFMVLEFLDGVELEDFVAAAPLPADWLHAVMEQVCSALVATHEAGIVHRDLKPTNVFLLPNEPYPLVKLLDFGIAKLPNVDQKLTQTGVLVGTPTSLAPEQLAQQSELIKASVDIYATGVLLYQLIVGKLPISHSNLAEHLMAIFNEIPPLLGNHRPELKDTKLETLVAQLLAKSPNERPATMKEVWKKLSVSLKEFDDPSQGKKLPRIKTIHGASVQNTKVDKADAAQGTTKREKATTHNSEIPQSRRAPLPTVDHGEPELEAPRLHINPSSSKRAPRINARPPLPTADEELPTHEPVLLQSLPQSPTRKPLSTASLTLYWMLITVFIIGVLSGIVYVIWQRDEPKPTPSIRATKQSNEHKCTSASTTKSCKKWKSRRKR